MEIIRFDMSRLRNSAHLKFHNDFRNLVTKFDFNIKPHLDIYTEIYNGLINGLNIVRKSSLTFEMAKEDKARRKAWRGLVDSNLAALNHADPEVCENALKLKIVFDSYGNVSKKTLIERTSSFRCIYEELYDNYALCIASLGLERWLSELKARNIAFDSLYAERGREEAAKSPVKVKEERVRLDKRYYIIINCIDAFAKLEGEEKYETFIKTMNVIASKYIALIRGKGCLNPDAPDSSDGQD